MNKLTVVGAAALLSLSTAAFTAPAHANDGFYAGPTLSHYRLDKDRTYANDSAESTVAGISLGYRFAGPLAVELGYGTNIGGRGLDVARLDLQYFIDTNSQWKPYLLLGVTDFDRDYSPSLKRGEGSTQQLGAGFGVAKMLDDRWQAKLDGRFQQKISGGASGTIDLGFNLGVNYFFNPAAPAAAPAPAPQPAPAAEVAPATRTVTVRLNVEFEFDKAVVRAIYGDELRAVAEAMKAHGDIDLVLEGHTDSIGTDAYNQDLSERRAAAVKERIAADYGIDRNRITTVGYGESRPIADNGTSEGRARNRRVIGELSYTEVVGD